MRMTTLNLWGYNKWSDREPEIVAHLKEVDPDVILFQEDVFLPHISAVSPVRALARHLQLPYRHESITRLQADPQGRPYREGLAMLSKYPIISTESLTLIQDERDEHLRMVQFADIDTPEGLMQVANIHLSITDDIDFATPQLKEIVTTLDARDERRIMAGDFNLHGMHGLEAQEDIWRPNYTLITEPEYISFPETNDRLDYFLLPNEYSGTNLQVSPDALSDHRAITIDIKRVAE